ncbi:MAG: hypothetical protein U0936_16575 [Planctomycetaceae bacterium]
MLNSTTGNACVNGARKAAEDPPAVIAVTPDNPLLHHGCQSVACCAIASSPFPL